MDRCVIIKNEFIDLGYEIWMRLLQKADQPQPYDPPGEIIEIQNSSEICIFPEH